MVSFKHDDGSIDETYHNSVALGTIWFNTLDIFCKSYQDLLSTAGGAIMLVVWELITEQLLKHGIAGNKLRVCLMEIQDDIEKNKNNELD
jgi:hypothetical protein|tara:strand:+ start:29 stop:298 length:270 start_codon:yes stop_codon:yes gene_type:complete